VRGLNIRSSVGTAVFFPALQRVIRVLTTGGFVRIRSAHVFRVYRAAKYSGFPVVNPSFSRLAADDMTLTSR